MELVKVTFVKFRESKGPNREEEREVDELFDANGGSSTSHRRAFHPFLCRLNETAAFTVTAADALIAAGFASMGMGLLTFFRPAPVLLFLLASHLNNGKFRKDGEKLVLVTAFTWMGVVAFVLVVLGLVLTFSARIKKRVALLLHPWGLMLLYLDVFVWLTLTLYFHLKVLSLGSLCDGFLFEIQHPVMYFIIIYVDCIVFCLLHYLYATYFIAAELSVIERFY